MLNCQALHVVDLSDCFNITDVGVEFMSKYGLGLQKVSLSRCHNVTVDALRTLASLSSLKAIDLFGCYAEVFTQIAVSLSLTILALIV